MDLESEMSQSIVPGRDHWLAKIFQDVTEERQRQERLRESGKFTHTCATPGMTDDASLRVLAEEIDEALSELGAAERLQRAFGKVARGMNDDNGPLGDGAPESRERRRKELIEVIAVAVAWIERMDNSSAQIR